ncbi:hypothetical protein [Pelagibacterium sp.]|uniref:hypothetical protein n=1 Tax=Pelagibacterium sp. TaxID=1967288 RepID=UPI003A90F377
MIVELVLFKKPPQFDDARMIEDARSVVDHWRSDPNLVSKHFMKSADGEIGGIYIWPNEQAARSAHDEKWRARFLERTGVEPTIKYFQLFMVIDNQKESVVEYPLAL